MIHRWKADKDGDYSDTCDSIEVILRTPEPETVNGTDEDWLEFGRCYSKFACSICVPGALTI